MNIIIIMVAVCGHLHGCELASSPGLLIGGRGEGEEGLVSTTCACTTFSVYFTLKVSINVHRQYPYVLY